MRNHNSCAITITHLPLLDGHTNMALDVALLEQAEQGIPGWRVYGWDGPWVSLGKQQIAERDLLESNLVPWTMRPTGGMAVLHGHDVTVGLAMPLSILGVDFRSVKAAYRRVIKPLVQAMRDCGHDVAIAEETEHVGRGPKSADCFAHVSPNDVVDIKTGAKACGCALRLTSMAVLVQASIPNGEPLVDPGRLFAVAQQVRNSKWDAAGFEDSLKCQIRSILTGS